MLILILIDLLLIESALRVCSVLQSSILFLVKFKSVMIQTLHVKITWILLRCLFVQRQTEGLL